MDNLPLFPDHCHYSSIFNIRIFNTYKVAIIHHLGDRMANCGLALIKRWIDALRNLGLKAIISTSFFENNGRSGANPTTMCCSLTLI